MATRTLAVVTRQYYNRLYLLSTKKSLCYVLWSYGRLVACRRVQFWCPSELLPWLLHFLTSFSWKALVLFLYVLLLCHARLLLWPYNLFRFFSIISIVCACALIMVHISSPLENPFSLQSILVTVLHFLSAKWKRHLYFRTHQPWYQCL